MVDIFRVLTTFQFEVGSAVLGAKTLQNATDNLSASADNALMSYKRLGLGLAGSMGLGTGGLLGTLYKAVDASERFVQTQLSFANILGANNDVFLNDLADFNVRLEHTERIMGKIQKAGQEFALPTDQLMRQTKLLTAILAPKGLAGDDLSTAIDISRGLLKSAPTLGVDPYLVEGQLLRMIEGSAGLGDTLFKRLVFETKAFEKVRDAENMSKAFNQLELVERVNMIREGLMQFGSDAEIIAGQVNSLQGVMNRLKDTITGPFGVLRPLGDMIRGSLVSIMNKVIDVIDTSGRQIIRSFSNLLRGLVEQPRRTTINLMQVRELGNDTRQASFTAMLIALGIAIRELPQIMTQAKSFFAMAKKGAMAGAGAYATGGTSAVFMTANKAAKPFLKSMFSMAGVMAALKIVGKGVVFVFTRLIPLMAGLVAFFQFFSRARAIARIDDMMKLPDAIARFLEAFEKFKVAAGPVLKPFADIINYLAELASWLFQLSFWMEIAISLMNGLAKAMGAISTVVVLAQATFIGLLAVFHNVFTQITEMIRTYGASGFSFDAVLKAFEMGANEVFRQQESFLLRNLSDLEQAPVAQLTQNIGKVDINMDFKEQQDPDRIAFTVQEALLKVAQNPSQAAGRSYAGAGLDR